MPDKETVLNILSVTPVEGSSGKRGRKNELMYLKAGVPYRYMLKNFFPALRSSTCIKVFYEKNKNIKTLEKNTGYSNYDQRNYNDLNNFYANNTKLDN